jgi:hypothetical protein
VGGNSCVELIENISERQKAVYVKARLRREYSECACAWLVRNLAGWVPTADTALAAADARSREWKQTG